MSPLLRLGQTDHVLILMMHHIVCDWASTRQFFGEICRLSIGLAAAASPLSCLPCRSSTAITRRGSENCRSRGEFAEDLAYWKENLRGAPALLDLPTDRPRPSVISYRGAQADASKSRAELNAAVRDCSRKEGVSLFTVFAAALNMSALSLHRPRGHPSGHSARRSGPSGTATADRLSFAHACAANAAFRRLELSGNCCFVCRKACLIFMPIALRPLTKW